MTAAVLYHNFDDDLSEDYTEDEQSSGTVDDYSTEEYIDDETVPDVGSEPSETVSQVKSEPSETRPSDVSELSESMPLLYVPSEITPITKHLTSKQKAYQRWITVEFVIIFFAASFGSLYVLIVPQYIENRLRLARNLTINGANDSCLDSNVTSNPDYVIEQEIAAETSYWVMLATTVSYCPALFICPLYGALGDHLGRKVHLLIPCIGGFLCIVCMLVVMYLDLSLTFYVWSNILYGFGGGYQFMMAGCFAYISDITTNEESRRTRLTVVQAVLLGTMGLIELPAGYIIEYYGFITAMWLCFGFSIAATLYIIIPGCLYESHTCTSSDCTPVPVKEILKKIFTDVYDLFTKSKPGKRRDRLMLLYLMYFITDVIQLSQSDTQIQIIYGLGPPFCWTSVTAGYFAVIFLGAGTLGMLIGNTFFSKCFSNFWILQIAYVFGLLNCLILAVAPNTLIFLLGTVVSGPRAMDSPVMNTLLPTLVTYNEQGVAFAVESSVQNFANVFSPLILNPIYSATVSSRPNIVFYVMASGFGVLFLLSWIWKWALKEHTNAKSRVYYHKIDQNGVENGLA